MENKNVTIVVHSGDFDKIMSAFIIGNGFLSMGFQVTLFFTFWGLNLLKKKFKPKVAGMPFPMKGMAAKMFKKRMKKFGIDDIWGMIKDAVDSGNMKLFPCQMTMDLMGIKREELLDWVEDPVGAATFLEMSDGGRIVSL